MNVNNFFEIITCTIIFNLTKEKKIKAKES